MPVLGASTAQCGGGPCRCLPRGWTPGSSPDRGCASSHVPSAGLLFLHPCRSLDGPIGSCRRCREAERLPLPLAATLFIVLFMSGCSELWGLGGCSI